MIRGNPMRAVAGLVLLAVLLPAASLVAQPDDTGSRRAWMGIYVRDLDEDDIQALDLRRSTRGAVVSGLDDAGPAARAGLEPGDVITRLDGRSIDSAAELLERLADRAPGDRVRLTVQRGKERKTFEFELAERPRELERRRAPRLRERAPDRDNDPGPRVFRFGGPRLGVRTYDLEDPHLAAYFDVEPGEGVLVLGVEEDSGAEEAGLQAGDVILEVDGERVADTDAIREVLAQHREGDRVPVRFKRQKKTRETEIELSEGFSVSGLGRLDRMPTLPRPRTWHFGDDLGDLRQELDALKRELRDLQRELRRKQDR